MNRIFLCRAPLLPVLMVAGAAALGGCAQIDPYTRQGIWQPSGVNDANLAAMVVDKSDLWYGRGNSSGSVRTATRAVERHWQGPQARSQGNDRQRSASQNGGGSGGPGEGTTGGATR
jgi:hypothetical protein